MDAGQDRRWGRPAEAAKRKRSAITKSTNKPEVYSIQGDARTAMIKKTNGRFLRCQKHRPWSGNTFLQGL